VPFGDLGRRFEAGQPTAAHDHGPGAQAGQSLRQQPGVVRRVEGVGVLVDAGDVGRVGGGAQRVDQRVVVQDVLVIDSDEPRGGVDAGDPAAHEFRAGTVQEFRDAQMGHLLTGRDLVQPQALGEPLARVDDRDPDVLATPGARRQAHRRGQSRVPPTDNHDLVHRPRPLSRRRRPPDGSGRTVREVR
jgi:hypothetical protein